MSFFTEVDADDDGILRSKRLRSPILDAFVNVLKYGSALSCFGSIIVICVGIFKMEMPSQLLSVGSNQLDSDDQTVVLHQETHTDSGTSVAWKYMSMHKLFEKYTLLLGLSYCSLI